MAFAILILLLTINLQASDDYDSTDPNLVRKRDGAMNYDQEDKLNDIDSTAGAIIMSPETLKIPEVPTQPKKKIKEPKKEPESNK